MFSCAQEIVLRLAARCKGLLAALLQAASVSPGRVPDSPSARSAEAAWRYLRGKNLDSGDSYSEK
jgi:hypothetical protein